MPLGTEVGLGPGYIMLNGNPAVPRKRGQSPQFSAYVCCGQTAGWIKMALGTKVGLGPDCIVLHGGSALLFSAHVYCGQTVAHLSYWTFGKVTDKMVVSHILCVQALSCIMMKNSPSILRMIWINCC